MKPLQTMNKKTKKGSKSSKKQEKLTAVSRRYATPLKAKDIKLQLEDVAISTGRQLVQQTSTTLINAVKASVQHRTNGGGNRFSGENDHLLDTSLISLGPTVSPKKEVSARSKKHSSLTSSVRSSPRRPKPIKYLEKELRKSQERTALENNSSSNAVQKQSPADGQFVAKNKEKISLKVKRIKSAVGLMATKGRTRLTDEADDDNRDDKSQLSDDMTDNCGRHLKNVEIGIEAIDYQHPNVAVSGDQTGILKRTLSKLVKSTSRSSIASSCNSQATSNEVSATTTGENIHQTTSSTSSYCTIS